MFVEIVSTSENICKKKLFFWFLDEDLNISDIFYKIQNLNWWLVFPVIPTGLILA